MGPSEKAPIRRLEDSPKDPFEDIAWDSCSESRTHNSIYFRIVSIVIRVVAVLNEVKFDSEGSLAVRQVLGAEL